MIVAAIIWRKRRRRCDYWSRRAAGSRAQRQRFRSGRLRAICLLLLSSACPAAQAAEPSPDEAAARWVKQLGAPSFAVREQATTELIRLGEPALQPLAAALREADPETRQRGKLILEIIRDDVLERRIARFSQSRAADADEGIPGWSRFRELAGGEPQARSLFAQMLRTEFELLELAERDPVATARRVDATCAAMARAAGLAGVESVEATACLVFLASDARIPISAQANSWIAWFCRRPSFAQAATSPPLQTVIARLLGGWFRRSDFGPHGEMLAVGLAFAIPESTVLARRLIEDQQSGGNEQLMALLVYERFGTASDVAVVEKLLDNQAACFPEVPFPETVAPQIRDVALRTLVVMTRQDEREFGFDRARFQQSLFGKVPLFLDEAHRDAALRRWRERRGSPPPSP